MDACTHGMPTPASCVECMNEGNLPPVVGVLPPAVVAIFAARYDGQCPECNLPMHVGDRVASLTSGAYVHADCGPGDLNLQERLL